MRHGFTPSLEQLGDRVTPSALTAAPPAAAPGTTLMTRQVSIIVDAPQEQGEGPVTPEGHHALVFLSGGIPSAAEGAGHLRGWLLVAKQRAARDTLPPPSPTGGERIGPFFQFKSDRLVRPDLAGTGENPADGRKFKMLVAPLVLELDNAQSFPDDLVGWNFVNGSSAGVSGPYLFAQDGRSSGM
jgi:hypothetical protein